MSNDNNDKAALITRLVEQYQVPLISYLTHLLRDTDLAADVAQETFLAAYLAPVRDTGNLKSWLYRIATNKAIDELRKQRRRPPYVDISDYYDALPHDEGDPQRTVPERLLAEEVWQQMPLRARKPLSLQLAGYPVATVAARCEQTISCTKMRLKRAKRAFREHYTKEAAA